MWITKQFIYTLSFEQAEGGDLCQELRGENEKKLAWNADFRVVSYVAKKPDELTRKAVWDRSTVNFQERDKIRI